MLEVMKDLKHYFTDNSRSCEASVAREVTEEREEDEVGPRGTPDSRKKRGRVKIKITKSKSRGSVCDIVENSDDLVDKTPSPFAPRDSVPGDKSRDETPRRSSRSRRGSERETPSCDSDFSPGETAAPGKSLDEKMEREESNAFRVLMTRKKPLQDRSLVAPTRDEEKLVAAPREEKKCKIKERKEKLILLADKKGYSKRKLTEIEEAEKMEKRLEKRAKFFQLGKKEREEKKSSAPRRSGGLHDYFSKAPVEQREKKDTVESTITVKAEIHSEMESEMIEIETVTNSDQSLMRKETNSDQVRVKKPRWSLRINLQSKDLDDTEGSTDENLESVQQRKKEGKQRAKEQKKNVEEIYSSDLAGSSVKSLRKKSVSTKNSESLPARENRSSSTERVSEIVVPSFDKIEEITESVSVIKSTRTEKLAPLFVKRQKLDPAILEARRAFLQSVPTEKSNRAPNRKVATLGSPVLPFPRISHVTQLGESRTEEFPRSTLPRKEIRPFVSEFDLEELKSVTSLGRETKSTKTSVSAKSSVDEVLKELEPLCPDVRKIWRRISESSKDEESPKSPKRRGRKKKSVEKKLQVLAYRSNKNSMWTEKYRPRNTRDILGNEEAAEKVRKWLGNWMKTSHKKDYSSGDEFYSSDCSYASNPVNNQVAVLLGPHGSGKTASVYAIAEELGYSVIEVNASSKRTGKKILKDLEEATKSHRIKKNGLAPFATITTENEESIPQNSLILMEDIDLVFEEDEGFISATFQLAANTKRPIVMTARDICSHMTKMAPEQTQIFYQTVHGPRVSAFLELVTLAEAECRLPRPCLDRLIRSGDVRKALLQLQYLLVTGKPNPSGIPTNFQQTLWQDARPCVYKPAMREAREKKKLSKAENSSRKREKSMMDGLAADLDKLSFLSTMVEIDDPSIRMTSLKLEPSLSLNENTHGYSSSKVTSHEIAEWLRNRLMCKGGSTDSHTNLQNLQHLVLKKDMVVSVNKALSHISPNVLDQSMLDYLAAVRTICRAEKQRSTKNEKRGNRFFHYLQNFRLPAISTRPSVLAAACEMLQDKS